MSTRPTAVAFDIIGTVFSLERLRAPLIAAGLPGETLEAWIAQTLRDAFALEVTEVYRTFREVAAATLSGLLAKRGLAADRQTVAGVLDGFAELAPHPDAVSAFRRLHEAGLRIVALTNSSAENTDKLLRRAGLDRFVELTISIDAVRHWKPRREVYLHAAGRLGVPPSQLALVAAHPWDAHGAGCAGLASAFVRRGKPYPATMLQPQVEGESLLDVAEALVRLHASGGSSAGGTGGVHG